MTQPSGVEAMLARDEIRSLAYRYAAAVEARDVEAMVELFTPRSRFGAYGEGPAGVRQLMSASMYGSLLAVILVANHLIDFDDADSARGQVWAHCFAHTRGTGFVEQLIKYEDRYERHDGRWLFLNRKHRLWYGVGHQPSPLEQAAANWPNSQTGVGDIPMADPHFRDWWSNRS